MVEARANIEKRALEECESEPIRTPDAIQPHGCMIVCDLNFSTVQSISENASEYFGTVSKDIMGLPLSDLFSPELIHALRNAASLRTFSLQREYLGEFEIHAGLVGIAAHMRNDAVIVEIVPHKESPGQHDFDINRLRWLMPRWKLEKHTLMDALVIMVNDLRTLTGFDRVMAYRFRPDDSGEVIAESLAPETDSFLGLRFPKWDIPQIARAISLEQPLRIISDIHADDVPLLSLQKDETPVDLTLAELRGTSPVHKQYLSNMGVQASLVLPMVVEGKLWGMFSLHHLKPKQFTIRQSLRIELVGQMLNTHLTKILRRDHEVNIKKCAAIVDRIPIKIDDASTKSRDEWERAAVEICDLFKLTGLSLRWGNERLEFGQVLSEFELEKVQLEALPAPGIFASDKIPKQKTGSAQIAGALSIDIDRKTESSICLFRDEENQSVRWAGAPTKEIADGETRLLPRSSFAAYVEESKGRSRPWEPENLLMAQALQGAFQNLFQREAERRADVRNLGMVVDELNHRVRNMLSLVQSVIQRSTIGQENVASYAEALNRRVLSLASAHDQLSVDHGLGLDLRSAIAREFSPFDEERFSLSGPDVILDLDSCTVFVLVFHEMVTNAVKYGALSSTTGRVEVEWAIKEEFLTLRFLEWGGPVVVEPKTVGYGSALITEAIPHQLGGEATITFHESGVEITLKIPGKYLVQESPVETRAALKERKAPERLRGPTRTGLILENNYLIAVELGALVRTHLGHDFRLAADNAAAAHLLEEEAVHFAILDINLANENCIETARLMRSKQIPFVFLTGYEDRQDLMEEFFDIPVISKPVKKDEFVQIVAPIAQTGAPKRQLKVLLVEDHVPLQKQLSLDVARLGHHIECASNVLEAEGILNVMPIDAIILDVFIDSTQNANLEGTLRIVSRIRNEIKNNYKVKKDVPIIAISGGMEMPGGFSPLRIARQVGVDAWIAKPIPEGALENWLADVEKNLLGQE